MNAQMDVKKKILVIDDDQLVTQTVKNLLVRAGYEPAFAKSGNEALKLVGSNQYDLILCDIRMPGLDGAETIKKINDFLKKGNRNKIPTFFFTGYANDKAIDEAKSMGDVLLKPYDIYELLNLVKKHLGENPE